MDYKEKYNTAIKRAKKLQETCDSTAVVGWCEYIFPELKESEGERIRKELIEQVAYIIPNDDEVDSEGDALPTYQKRIDKYRSWLEKQEPIDKDKLAKGVLRSVATTIMQYLDSNTAEGKMCLSNMECEDIENAVFNADWAKVYRYMKKKLEKLGEQKPYGQRKECEDCQFNYAGKCEGLCQIITTNKNKQMVTETNKQRWFWWHNDKSGNCGASLHCRDDCVFAYDAEVEQKIFAINDVIDNLQRLGIISKSLSREQYRALWMHLLAVNNDEHLQSFYHHHVSDYCFDNDESEFIDKYLAEGVAIGSIDYNEKRDDVLAKCAMIGGNQDVCFEVLKGGEQ